MKKIIVSLAAVLLLAGCGHPGYSQGKRTGELVKVSYKGLIWKSWEGELKIQEGGSSESDNGRWEFSIPTEENNGDLETPLVRELKFSMGKKVVINYDQCFLPSLHYDSSYYAVAVYPADAKP